jgi:hypothetical protein
MAHNLACGYRLNRPRSLSLSDDAALADKRADRESASEIYDPLREPVHSSKAVKPAFRKCTSVVNASATLLTHQAEAEAVHKGISLVRLTANHCFGRAKQCVVGIDQK